MTWGAVAGAAIGTVGGIYAANKQADAAERSAAAAEFKPFNVTTGLGNTKFGKNKVSYTLDPRLRDYQDNLFGLAANALPDSANPDEAAANLFARYQSLAAPIKERSFGMLQNSQFNNGTLGLATGGTSADAGGYAQRNPALAAWLEAQQTGDRNMFLQAEKEARGFLDSDLNRISNIFGNAVGVENVGYDMINAGAGLGGRQAQAGATAAQVLARGYGAQASGYGNVIDSLTKGLTQAIGNYNPQPTTPTTISNQPVNNTSSSYWGR